MSKLNILKTLLTNTFNNKLLFLEKRSETHISLISSTIKLAKSVTNMCIGIKKRIIEKPSHHTKAQIRTIKQNKSVSRLMNSKEKCLPKSKSHSNLMDIHFKPQSRILKKNKSTFNLRRNMPSNSINSRGTKTLSSKINIFSSIQKIPMKSQSKGKTANNSKCSKKNINNLNTNRKTGLTLHDKKLGKDNTNRMLSMESNIQCDKFINPKDPLLVSPSAEFDLDLFAKVEYNKIKQNKHNLQVLSFNVEEFFEDHIAFISKFLIKSDIINLLMINKLFNRVVRNQIVSDLENEKKGYERKIEEISQKEIPKEQNPQEFHLSKGANKAIVLLNEAVLNKLFTEKNVPSNDILLIYEVYFQLINHPIVKSIKDSKVFWKNCYEYFIKLNRGKTGELLIRNIKEIVWNIDNIYKVIHIIGNDMEKISPSYFSKICGTTGLFVFFVKDVLDFFGISCDEKFQPKAYWTYKKIVALIDTKVQKIKQFTKI